VERFEQTKFLHQLSKCQLLKKGCYMCQVSVFNIRHYGVMFTPETYIPASSFGTLKLLLDELVS